MTIWKTSPLKASSLKILSLSAYAALIFAGPAAFARQPFQCLRELIPATEVGAVRLKRGEFGRPVLLGRTHIAIPELRGTQLTAIYLYSETGARRFERARRAEKHAPLSTLTNSTIEFTAQPEGLDTVTMYWYDGTVHPGPKTSEDVELWSLVATADNSGPEVMRALYRELRLREDWVQGHNLDDAAFKLYNRALAGPCAK